MLIPPVSILRRVLLLWAGCVLLPLVSLAAVPGDPAVVTGSPAAQDAAPSPAAAISEGRPGAIVAAEPRRLGMDAYEKEDYPKAVEHLSAAQALDPADLEVTGRLGFSLKETGAYEKALRLLEEVAEKAPENYYHWWWMSDTQRLLGRYEEALRSMESAVKYAPETEKAALQEYVGYTATLSDRTLSWENVGQHVDFAERHRKNRRVRRQIAEYAVALAVAPSVADGDKEGALRLMWINQEVGTQYNYIEEPDVAVDYFLAALGHAARGENRESAMRNHQNLAISWRMLHDRDPGAGAAHMERAAGAWRDALAVAREIAHTDYIRYCQGRLLETLAVLRPLDDPEVAALRELNDKEVPWKGPVNDFFTAEAVAGELACRLAEGDNAGARILAEIALPYYEASTYLSDFQRAVDVYLKLAAALNRQGHPADALAAVDKAEAKAAAGRQFMDADAFNRGTGQRMLRSAAVARVRALAALGQHEDAFAAVESFKTARVTNLLGGSIADDSARTDAASEREAVRLRVPWIEARLKDAEAAGDAEEIDRLLGRLARDVERLAWLDRAVEFVSPENLNYAAAKPGELTALRGILPGGTLLLHYAVDVYGAVVVMAGADFVEARALDLNEAAALSALYAVRAALAASADAAAPLAGLSAGLLDPCAERLAQAQRVVLCPDEVLSPLPWPLMTAAGAPLGQSHVLSFAESAGLLLKSVEKPAVKAARLRAFLPADASGDAAGLPAGDHVFGAEATLTRLLEGAVPEDLLFLSAKLNLTPPDPMLCPVLLGGEGVQGETPSARVLGLNLPAAAVMLDWTAEPAGSAPRTDVFSVLAEAFRHAGASSVILPLWPVAPAVAREYLTAFLAAQAGTDRASAARDAAAALRAAHPESPDWAAFRLTGDFR